MKIETNEVFDKNKNNINTIDLSDDEVAYIHVGGHVIYIDNSTDEMIVKMWEDGENDDDDIKVLNINE